MAGKSDNYIGIAMGLDVTELKAGLQETKKAITTANKQFAAATSGMDDWSKSVEGLEAKLEQLDTVLDMQKRNVRGIQAELDKAKAKYGENSEQVRKLNDKLLDATAAVGKTEKAQRKYSSMLDQVKAETKGVDTATGKMTKGLKKADRATVDLKGGFSVLKGAMANLVSTGITSMVSGLQNIVSESREFRKEMAYLEATADSTGASFENAKENLKEVTAITEDQGAAVEGLNNLMSSGFDGDALDQITDQLVGASIKWKDTLKFEGLSDGLQETLATGQAVGPFAELLERAGINLDTFDEGLAKATTDAEKQNYVLETLGKLGLQEIKDGYVEANKTLIDGAKANMEYSEAMAEVGELAEPTLSTIKLGFADVLKSILDTGDGMDSTDLNGKIREGFDWFIEECVPFIKDALGWIIDNFKEIAIVVGAIGTAFLAWKVVSIIMGVVNAVKALNLVTLLFNTTLWGCPIIWIIAGITAVIAAIVLLWKNWDQVSKWLGQAWEWLKETAMVVWEAIKGFFIGAWESIKAVWDTVVGFFKAIWEGIKAVFMGVVNFYKTVFTTAWNVIKAVWSAVVSFFQGIWNGIVNVFSGVGEWFRNIFSTAWSNITGVWNTVSTWFKTNVFDKIVNTFTDLPGKMLEIGENMMKGLIDGVGNMIEKVKEAVHNAVDSAVEGVKDFLGIESPSKLMKKEVGMMMGAGVGDGLIASTKGVIKKAGQFTQAVTGSLQGDVSRINSGLSASIPTVNGASNIPTTVNNNFTQVINAPKQPSRLELYRQSKNLLNLKGAY